MKCNILLAIQHRLSWGMLGLSLMALAACSSEPKPVTSQTSKYEVAEDAASPAGVSSTDMTQESTANTAEGNAIPPAETEYPRSVGSSEAASPEQPTSLAGAPKKPSSSPPAAIKALSPDSNDPKEMLAHLNELLERQPQGTSRAEQLASLQETQREILQVADRILGADADEATELAAVEGKVRAYSTLIRFGQPEVSKELQAFLATLTSSKNPGILRLSRRMTFAQRMDAYGASDFSDSKKLLKEFQDLMQGEDKDASLFMLGNQVLSLFMQSDKNAELVEAMKLVRDTFSDHSDPKISAQARSLDEQIKLVELDINLKLKDYDEGTPAAEKALFDTLDQLFASKDLGPTTLNIALQIAQFVESRNFDSAGRIYEQVNSSFGNHSDAEVAKAATTPLENYQKRKALIGQPLSLQGVTLDGSPFDWSSYKGKIVLVDFWATWCQPCLAEMPNIRQNYELYRPQGFEVVGVNIDESPEDVERFFSRQKLDWAIVRSKEPSEAGFQHPVLVKGGAEGIPFLILVGRDGNVIALNLRGDRLGKKLAELMPANPDAPTEPNAKPKSVEKTGLHVPNAEENVSESFVGFKQVASP